jgi:hypothetical protein
VIRDGAGEFRRAYGLRGPGLYLVRPDGHVGFRACGYDGEALREHLSRTFRGDLP